ncbi:MAG: tRNA pseudouridine(38-40) synthase TruA [Thermoanaerobaculia bacterium]|nr:tRNA pseudouridine(38-40) synthase TruA [Thermoanaerobaculia bacterium]
MTRSATSVRLTIAYDGAPFAGWQRQQGVSTVQETLEDALAELTRTDLVAHGAGRTDAGVHALGQVAHLARRGEPGAPLPDLPIRALVTGSNHFLPASIRVLDAQRLAPGKRPFHAQRSATGKRYAYRIFRGRVAPPFEAERAFHVHRPLDVSAMASALRSLPGRHDFSAFALAGGSHSQGVRRLYSCRIDASPEGHLRVEFWGEGFLRGMVRSLVGTLVEIGQGDRPVDDMARLLGPGRKRREAGITAPAQGLCLEKVAYPDDWPVLEQFGRSRSPVVP